jgi:serine/threonine protein kinase
MRSIEASWSDFAARARKYSMPRDEEPGGFDPGRDFHEIDMVLHGPDDEPAFKPMLAGEGQKRRGFAGLDEFVRSLLKLGLVTSTELERFAADSAEGVLGLSRALVNVGKLTPYQAAAIYQKKARGLLIGNYLILDKLGQGGMGVVFKARHRTSGRVGALKILPPSFARDKDAVSRFRREIEAAGRLNHPNVVAAIDSDEDRGVHFLVMDYVSGRDLDRVVRDRGPMPVSQAVDCLIQAARGLEAAHAQGIIHRDIKPGNLILDTAGAVRVLDLGLARIVDASNPFNKTAAGRLTQSGMYMGTVDFMAPEQAEDAHRVDHRADIYSLGCTLHFLMTGREPFPADTVLKRLLAHMERDAPSLRTGRTDVPMALESCYQKMMAKRPDDRPRSMTEVIAFLQASKLPADDVAGRIAPPPKSRPELMVFNEAPLKRASPPRPKAEPSILARREEREGLAINHELNLEDLVMDVRSDNPPARVRPAATTAEPLNRSTSPAFQTIGSRQSVAGLIALAAAGLMLVAFAVIVVSRSTNEVTKKETPKRAAEPDVSAESHPVELEPPAQPAPRVTTIFDGMSGRGWMLCNRAPLPPRNIQPDGLNPHGTGSYLAVYDQKLGDFVLDFDYKLSAGCNSGVFLRVSDLTNPVQTGIEVALDDSKHRDDRDSGAFYGLVAPRLDAQWPSGRWNHMTITAEGPRLAVSLNQTEVATINLDEWTVRGKRPDGSDHIFKERAVGAMARSGYLGFQDLGSDCWFKNIILKTGTGGPRSSPLPPSGKDEKAFTEIGEAVTSRPR